MHFVTANERGYHIGLYAKKVRVKINELISI